MLHNNFPPTANDATIAAYFLYGMEAGLLSEESAKEWAFELIAARDNPAIEIIEIAMAVRREDIFNTVGVLAVEPDLPVVFQLLMSELHRRLSLDQLPLRTAIRTALQIAFSTQGRDSTYYDLDLLDDELHLAESGTFGTVADIRTSTLALLARQSVGAT